MMTLWVELRHMHMRGRVKCVCACVCCDGHWGCGPSGTRSPLLHPIVDLYSMNACQQATPLCWPPHASPVWACVPGWHPRAM